MAPPAASLSAADVRRRLFASPGTPPAELPALSRALYDALSGTSDAPLELLADCLTLRGGEFAGWAVDVATRVSGSGKAGSDVVGRLRALALERAASLPPRGLAAAAALSAIALLNDNGKGPIAPKDHVFSVLATANRASIPLAEREILERVLPASLPVAELGMRFSKIEPFLRFLLWHPAFASDAGAQVAVSSAVHRVLGGARDASAADKALISQYVASHLLPSPLAPTSLLLRAARWLLCTKEVGPRIAVLGQLADAADRLASDASIASADFAKDLWLAVCKSPTPATGAALVFELATICSAAFHVGSSAASQDDALPALASSVDLLEKLPADVGPGPASLVLSVLVHHLAEREGRSGPHAAQLRQLLERAEARRAGASTDGAGALVAQLDALRRTHPALSRPGLSLIAANTATLLSPPSDPSVFSTPFFLSAALLAHPSLLPSIPPSQSFLAEYTYLLSNPTPPLARALLASLTSLASPQPSSAFATARAVRTALSLPDSAARLRVLSLCAAGNGRAWRWWAAELGGWARKRAARVEEMGRKRKDWGAEGYDEEEAMMTVVGRAISDHPRSAAQPAFPVLLALLRSQLLRSPVARAACVRSATAAASLGLADPRAVWHVAMRAVVEEAMAGEDEEMWEACAGFLGVCGELWDESEAYTAFLNDDILPRLLPRALPPAAPSSRRSAAQSALSFFPITLLAPHLPPEVSSLVPHIDRPLLSALMANELSTMRRSVLRGTGSTGRARAEPAPALVDGARAALGTLESLAERPAKVGAKPGYILGALLGSSGAPPPGVSPVAYLQKREKLVTDAVKDLTGIVATDQPVLGRLGAGEAFARGWDAVWSAAARAADVQVASGGDAVSARSIAEARFAELVGKMADPKSPLEAGNAAASAAGLCRSLVRSGEAELGTRLGRSLLSRLLEPAKGLGDEGNDEVGAARALAIAALAPSVVDRTDNQTWTSIGDVLKKAAEAEDALWTRWSGAVGLGTVLRAIPRNLEAFDTALQNLLSLPDQETGKGIGLACCAVAVKEQDPTLFEELLEVALIALESLAARKAGSKPAEFQGVDGSAFFVGWSAPLIADAGLRTRARTALVKSLESVNEKKDLALHTLFAIAVSHFFANDADSEKEHAARLNSIAGAAAPSLSSVASVPSLLGFDMLANQPSATALPFCADAAASTKLLSKLSTIMSASAELRLARVAAIACGRICGTTLEEDTGPALLGGKKEPADLSRLEAETSYVRAVFDGLRGGASGNVGDVLLGALETVEGPLPAVDWAPLVNAVWDLGDLRRRTAVFVFASRHCVVSGSRSLLDFLMSKCERGRWGRYELELQLMVLGDAGIGRLLDIAGLEPAWVEGAEGDGSEDTQKMTIAPTKLISVVSEAFEEAHAHDNAQELLLALMTTLHGRLAEHRTSSQHDPTAEIPVAAQLASLLCRVFVTLPLPTDLTTLRLLRLGTESIACDARVLDYFLGGASDGDPSRDVVKVCVAWELSARGAAAVDFGMPAAVLASKVLENEFAAMVGGPGRRARVFAAMGGVATQLAAEEAAELRSMMAGKEARLPPRLRTVLARRSVVLKWLGRLLDTGIVVGSGYADCLCEYVWLVVGSFAEMCLGGEWWKLDGFLVADVACEDGEDAVRGTPPDFEFEPALAEEGDGVILASRLGRLLLSFLSGTLAADAKALPEIAPQQIASSQILRRIHRILGLARAVASATDDEAAVLGALWLAIGGERTVFGALVAADREAWTTLAE
ncbi:hypothetical protein DFJ74DRAFT_652482 [Hyaloraphidium curvatum]|nr:hypothetical protein DFJ74DRAFT_652482 [Hyaloraphidium curvatum]